MIRPGLRHGSMGTASFHVAGRGWRESRAKLDRIKVSSTDLVYVVQPSMNHFRKNDRYEHGGETQAEVNAVFEDSKMIDCHWMRAAGRWYPGPIIFLFAIESYVGARRLGTPTSRVAVRLTTSSKMPPFADR